MQTTVTNFMSGRTTDFSNFSVSVSGTHLGVATPVNGNLTAGRSRDRRTVSGTYKFLNIIPLIKMPTSFSITSSVIMGCEGGV